MCAGWPRSALVGSVTVLIAVAALADAWLRVRRIARSPINVTQGDMLPLLQAAVRTFAAGANPYCAYHVPWEIHLTYYPGLWLAYLPAELLHVDYRYVGVAAIVGVAAVFCFVLARQARAAPPDNAFIAYALATAAFACSFLIN